MHFHTCAPRPRDSERLPPAVEPAPTADGVIGDLFPLRPEGTTIGGKLIWRSNHIAELHKWSVERCFWRPNQVPVKKSCISKIYASILSAREAATATATVTYMAGVDGGRVKVVTWSRP